MKTRPNIVFAISSCLLLVLFLVLDFKNPVQAGAEDTSVSMPVSITENDPAPEIVKGTVGSTVVWTNLTNYTLNFVGDEPYSVYLPLVIRVESLFESVLYMPGDVGSAYAPDNTSLDLGVGTNDDFTIEAFFYVPDLSYDDTSVDVLARKNNSFSFYIHFHDDEPDRIYFTLELLGYGEILLWHETDIQIGWHHVAAVFDNEYTANEDAFSIFLDGVRVAHSPDESIHVDWTPGLPNTISQLDVGGVGGGGFHGYLEEIRISDIVRYNSPTYTIPTEPFSPDGFIRALWHFNEIAGSTVFMDTSSYDNHLTGYSGAQTYNP